MRLAVRRLSPTGRPEIAERHAVCRRPLRTWRSRSALRFGFPDSRARSQPAGLPKAVECSLYLSIPIARVEARWTNYRKEPGRQPRQIGRRVRGERRSFRVGYYQPTP